MIDQNTVDQIVETANIADVIGDFVDLNRKGSNLQACCPFHNEKTPSFSVSPTKGIFKCFGCGEAGGSIQFIEKYQNKTFPEALQYLADKYGIPIREEKQDPEKEKKAALKTDIIQLNQLALEFYIAKLWEPENATAAEYALSRFYNESLGLFEIGYAPKGWTNFYDHARKNNFALETILESGLVKRKDESKFYDFFINRLIFPIHNQAGQLIAFAGRIIPGEDSKYAKFMNLPDTPLYNKSKVLYGLNHSIKVIATTRSCVLVEGNPDLVKLNQIGVNNVVAPSGTALASGHINLLKRFSDKQILLYDGDAAGLNALEKNGKLLVEAGLIPYAAILPRDHDPDTWFKDLKHFNNWIGKYSTDFIAWYSEKTFRNIGQDPSKKNDAVIRVTDLLQHLTSATREIYIERITLNSKVKPKLFTDRLKELEAKARQKEKPTAVVPFGVDANDFEKWGFYEYKNAYFFRGKSGIEKLSNFTMKPIFHIDNFSDSKRIYELMNEHGYSVVVNLDMNEMTSLQGFQRNVESKGNFMFWGQMAHFQKLKLKLYEITRTCYEIENLGWQPEGFWSWANGATMPDGSFQEIDKYGIINVGDQDYFIPAFSRIYLKDKSIFLDERKFQFSDSDLTIEHWMSLFIEVHGKNAMIGFAWYLSSLFRDHILRQNDNFPLLNLFGQKGSGKNTLAYSLLSLFGKKQTEYNIHNGTKAGLAKHLEMFRNSIAFIDEYKNSLEFDKIETLKSIYNAIGRSRLNMDKGGKKETTEVNQGVIIAGQEMPTVDVALSSRMLFLQFLSKEGLSVEQKNKFEKLQELERDGLPHITVAFLKERKYFIEYYKEHYDQVMRDMLSQTTEVDLNDRLLRNACTVVASFKTLAPKFKFSFSYEQVLQHAIHVTLNHNKQIRESDEIGVFWNLLEAMLDEDILIDRWHFKIAACTKITTKTKVIELTTSTNVLKFKFNVLAKLYAEQLRRKGEKPLPQDSLQHYLMTNKHFIGVEKACRFYKTEFNKAEGKTQDIKQTTSAFCFRYDDLGINLTRELEYGSNGSTNPYNKHTDDNKTKSTIISQEADQGKLGF